MDAVSNRFFAYLIKDGKSVSAILRCNTTLSQTVYPSGACTPNWNANEQGHDETPVIWAQCRLSGRPKAPNSDFVWKWNGSAITFDSSGKSNGAYVQVVGGTTYPIFEKTTVSESGVAMPGLKVLRNLANFASNTDNDLITLDAALECSGVPLGFTISQPIRIQESSGTGWFGWVTGDPRVTETAPSTTLSARLKNGVDAQQTFTAKFYRDGIDAANSPLFTVNAAAGVANATFTTSHITDNVVVRVEFYVDNTLRDTVYFNIDDETDEMELQVTSRTYTVDGNTRTKTGSGQGDVVVRESQEVLFTFYMGHRMHPENIYSGYTKFYIKLTNNEGAVLSPSAYASQIVDGQESGTWSHDSNYRNVTVSLSASGADPDPVTGPGGKIRLTADFLDNNGDGVGGIVVSD